MKRLLSLLTGIIWAGSSLLAQQTTGDLLISEYCEYNHLITTPKYYNHYIEIYNGTGETVDMSQYQLWRAMNGGGWNIDSDGIDRGPLSLRGYLENNKTYVITRPDTETNPITISGDSAQSWDFLNISGDDAVGLAKNDGSGNFILLDIIGDPNVDPGDYWSVAGSANGTQNHTLIRKPGVCDPNTDWDSSAGTTADNSEWIVLPENDISDINRHSCLCNGEDDPGTGSSGIKHTALFIGNSYTYYNDLPILIDRLANSVGDTLVHKESYPGGYRLSQHYVLDETLNLIKATNYDFVVLQEQSQRPAVDSALFFEYALKFDKLRRIYSPCGQTMFYMTWGRKYGDANNCAEFPDVCTYEGMDSVLCVRYLMAQEKTEGLISPVGRVRNYIIHNYPYIELYEPDYSHPTPAGSFVSAVTFYAVMFKKDPTLCSYNFSLSEEIAGIIKLAAKTVVFDVLDDWNTYDDSPDSTILVNISYPQASDILHISETYTAEVEANCTGGSIDSVEFYLNGNRIGGAYSAPYTTSLSTNKTGTNNLIVTAYKSTGTRNFMRVDFSAADATGGIDQKMTLQPFHIFPNPAETLLNIQIDNAFESGSLTICSLAGKIFQTLSLSSTQNTCDISDLEPGMYILQLQLDDSRYLQKLFKR